MSLIKQKKIPSRTAEPEEAGGLYFTSEKKHIEFLSSGCALLDCVLGGGWPLGRISNIVGDKSTGKTLLAIEACANFARKFPQGDILYVETEAAFDMSYAEALGLPAKRLTLVNDIDTVEELFECLGEFIGTDLTKDDEKEKRRKAPELREKPGLVIVDSLDALSDKAEMGRAISDGTFGAAKAKQMSQLFRRLVRPLERTKTHVQIISQVRDAIGVTFGDKHTRSGGKALDFYASHALWLALMQTEKKVVNKINRAVGLLIRARCKKNKVALPLRECEFTLRFGYGIEDLEAGAAFLVSIGKEREIPMPVERMKKLRGTEFREAREAFNKVVVAEWLRFEKNYVPERTKYGAG